MFKLHRHTYYLVHFVGLTRNGLEWLNHNRLIELNEWKKDDNYLGCSKHIWYTYYIHIMQGISLRWLEMV